MWLARKAQLPHACVACNSHEVQEVAWVAFGKRTSVFVCDGCRPQLDLAFQDPDLGLKYLRFMGACEPQIHKLQRGAISAHLPMSGFRAGRTLCRKLRNSEQFCQFLREEIRMRQGPKAPRVDR
jgi:hypothetical protein